ncbi:GTPase IMAP family member 7 isoform X2 [Gouania willdenowi]|uniref:GTPase IMAP family member 7-like n=1 Tax=Gouania willdenowi TaxID=441366 RepID=A0A8C5GVR9_GOUWI|nr:GTPase IMAP family member 7-like isoform X2 [Gouania willdenowi]
MRSWNSRKNAASLSLRVLLLGPRRTGKSSAGNTLLGRERLFDTSGGNASTRASRFTAGRHLTVVDAQGWGSSEEVVPRQEKVELLRALSLCGPEGPHVILLVVPLLDFTESDRRIVETRMEVLTPSVWRHIMVVFTFGDLLKRRGRTAKEHIQSGGPALQWLMEKCCYRYHVLDNTKGVSEVVKQERIKTGSREEKKNDQSLQVRELLSQMEDLLEENGRWHFSLHMYQRLEEEWSRRELQLRAQLDAEVRHAIKEEEEEEEEEEGKVKDDNEENEKKTMEDATIETMETMETMEEENEESVKLKADCQHNGRLVFCPIRGLA